MSSLLLAIDRLSGVSAASSEAAACDEMGLALCELLGGGQCEVLKVAQTDEEEMMLELSPTFFLRAEFHGVFGRVLGAIKPVSFPDVGSSLGSQLAVIEW